LSVLSNQLSVRTEKSASFCGLQRAGQAPPLQNSAGACNTHAEPADAKLCRDH
jgi:hypothetical protein